MDRLVLFDSIESLKKETQRLESQYGVTLKNVINDNMINSIPDDSKIKKILPTPKRDIRHHMNNLIRCTNCYPLFFSNLEDPRDAYTILYSNGLACALLSLSYLYGEAIPKESLCNKWDSNDTRFLSEGIWSKALNGQYFQRIEKLESKNQDHLACPYMYLSGYTDGKEASTDESFKTNQLLLPLYQKIVGDIIAPNTNGAMYSIKNVFDNHILSLNQLSKNCIQICESMSESENKDKKSQDNLRAHKRRLRDKYNTFYKALIDQPIWDNDKTDFSRKIMFRFAKELIYHSEAIARLERDLSKLDLTHDNEIMNRLMKLNTECQLPIVFHVDKLKFSKRPPLGAYCDYLKALAILLYEYAGEDLDTACSLIIEIISEEKVLFPKPYCESDQIADEPAEFPDEPAEFPEEPTEFPEEHQEKHWLIVKVAAVCACYEESISYTKHSYDTQSYPEFFRTLVEVDTVTNNQPLEIVKKFHKCESVNVSEEPAESPEEHQENCEIS